MRKKTILYTAISFLLFLSYIIASEYYIGPMKIPNGKPLHFEEIVNNIWDYVFLALVVTIIGFFGYRADKRN
jgi:hypothetical protein